MKRAAWILFVLTLLATLAALYPQAGRNRDLTMPEAATFRVLLGVSDTTPANWDGSVTLSGGTVTGIQGWRFAGDDSTDMRASWKMSTRPALVRANEAKQKKKAAKKKAAAAKGDLRQGPIEDNGVVITASLQNPSAVFTIATAQGKFSFTPLEVPFGQSKTTLDGRARIDRVPTTTQLTTSIDEQDHPALAQSGDDVYLVYVDFTHGDRGQVLPQQLPEDPRTFDSLARPVGGDKVCLMRYSRSRRSWSAPEDVSAAKQDIMRAAVAVDGRHRVWVIWSAQRDGNFDLYARRMADGQWSNEMRVTSNPGQDINPVATTDSAGRVWVAWQAYRNGNLEVLATAQDGDRFRTEERVSFSPHSDWDPVIAAGSNGEVAVAWDTYDKGDYDVWVRRMRYNNGVRLEAPVAVAASGNFEARPSIAYDSQNRIWIAYEASDAKWGKDFGAYETSGIGLYQGHDLKVRCLQGGALCETEDDVASALPGGQADPRRRRAQLQQSLANLRQPNPELARNRQPSAVPQPPPLPKNSFPRIVADSNGAIYLAYRIGTPRRSPIGWIWNEQIVFFDGELWQGPVDLPHSDGLLDVRPALLANSNGGLLMVMTNDHRQDAEAGRRAGGGDGINSDLYAAELNAGPAKTARLKSLPPERAAAISADAKAERDQIALMRNYRAHIQGRPYQVMRGEFHRHTELSGDGGMSDGPIIDAYRYMIDAASMDWGGCCDHDNGGGREYYWWMSQKLTDAYHLAGHYTAMFSHERSVRYPEGHRNMVMARRGIRPLPRLPILNEDAPFAPAPDTQMLYRYLHKFDGIVASHTSGTNMGTDWRDNDPIVEPVVEIYQGDRQNYEMPGAPRSNNESDSIGGWRPLGFVSLALEKGYRLGFQASSDHVSTHMSYCNLWVAEPTRDAVMEAFKKRRVYGATENILADVRCAGHFMGEEFKLNEQPAISVKLWGTDAFARVSIIKDGRIAYVAEPNVAKVDFIWRDEQAERGKTSYYYVRGEQNDGELVWVSPMWIKYE